ncbi:Mitogen-activated protein kinase kinase kinase NPK1 [Acorus gramineus]|uniref:Mitogen-activated protein kinase kinase kinase NPK1 n=1 Tax=Acorus gramineus TaxID=55184 RepID=A0AAV9BFT2_ACOGR|nr:Mitogen-activated protein kinase kinase kinase NPK1 [Acorus gramineus]
MVRPKEWVRGNAIGSGSFGVVSLAMDKSTGHLFVVKSAPTGTRSTLKHEADILATLDSPHVVRCLGHHESRCGFDLFMEHMAGGSLSDIVRRFGGLPTEAVIRSYTRDILRGLEYLHRNRIAHCDIKCKNVLLGSAGNVKLADFGCARRLDCSNSKNPNQPISGTPLWMAPEVLRNEGLGLPADVWSLGCTVIEMATGRPPWADDVSDPMAAVLKIACGGELPRFPVGFSAEGIDFLSKCLQRDPRLRWTCEELLEHRFIRGTAPKGVATDSRTPTGILEYGFDEAGWDSEEIPTQIGCLTVDRKAEAEAWILIRSG